MTEGEVIASYLAKVTIRSLAGEIQAPTIDEVERVIEEALAITTEGPGALGVRASAERTDI